MVETEAHIAIIARSIALADGQDTIGTYHRIVFFHHDIDKSRVTVGIIVGRRDSDDFDLFDIT